MKKALLFENVTCGRCGGSGRYSYNAMHGSVCYGCSGAGVKLTKRGRAAQNYLESLRSKPAGEFVVGDLMRQYIGISNGTAFYRITKIIFPAEGSIRFYLHNAKVGEMSFECGLDHMCRAGFDGETKEAQKAKALAYQATLTKMGKPMKLAA